MEKKKCITLSIMILKAPKDFSSQMTVFSDIASNNVGTFW